MKRSIRKSGRKKKMETRLIIVALLIAALSTGCKMPDVRTQYTNGPDGYLRRIVAGKVCVYRDEAALQSALSLQEGEALYIEVCLPRTVKKFKLGLTDRQLALSREYSTTAGKRAFIPLENGLSPGNWTFILLWGDANEGKGKISQYTVEVTP